MKESENFMLNLKGEVVNELSDVQLSEISGGGKSGANTFLAGAAGAAEGVMFCAQAGVCVPPAVYVACAGAGAIAGIVFPH